MHCEKPHNEADTEQSFTDSPLSLIETSEFFLILPAWWNQIIITGLITDTAVTLACMISQNSNPMLLFVFSSTHQLMNEANRNTNHTTRE